MKNKLIRFNRWLDKNELFKFGFMISYIVIAMLNLTTGSLVASVLMMWMICAFVIYRMFIVGDFDRSKYNVPEVGEIVVVKKDFWYDGQFRKSINQSDPSQKPNWWKVPKGTELVILNIEETDGDWMITLEEQSRGDLHLYYIDTKDYWDTKANIRSRILSKIGI